MNPRIRGPVIAVLQEKDNRYYADISFGIISEKLQEAVIYRAPVKDVAFSIFFEACFDTISFEDAKEIFRGQLDKVNSFYNYKDYDIEVNETYAYWLSTPADPDSVTGPIVVKVRDKRVWWPFDKIMKETYDLAENYSNVSTVVLGETLEHRPLVALRIGNPDNVLALIGAVHPGEAGPEISLRAARTILEKHPEVLEKAGLVILPSVCADQRERMVRGTLQYLRLNSNGVDLNRNFDADWDYVDKTYGYSTDDARCFTYRGAYPNSEPETKAVVKLLEDARPKIVLSFHSGASVATDEMLHAMTGHEDPEYMKQAKVITETYQRGFRRELGIPVKEGELPSCFRGGSIPNYAYTKGIIGFDLEYAWEIEYFRPHVDDKATPEMLDLSVRCHTNAITDLLEYMGRSELSWHPDR